MSHRVLEVPMVRLRYIVDILFCDVMCYCGLLLCFLSDFVCFVTGVCFRYLHESAICNYGIACSQCEDIMCYFHMASMIL
jgi:hypothetical protein